MLNKNDKFNVCLYGSKGSKYFSNVDLDELLNCDTYKQIIEELRKQQYKSEKYDAIKNDLPQFTASAKFEQGKGKTVENAKVLPLICIDIDLNDNKEWFEHYTIEDTKYLIDTWFCSARNISLSCGGKGLFVIHRLSDKVTKDTFRDYFNELKILYKRRGIVIDAQCANVNRLRFVSYDDFVLNKEIYTPYELQGLKEENENIEKNYDYEYANFDDNTMWIVNPSFNINDYEIKNNCDIDGFNAIRRVWLAMTVKKFFGLKGLQLAEDIFKTYPNSIVKEESLEHLRAAYKGKSGCVRTVANDLCKLGILVENNKNKTQHIFNLNNDEYISDVIDKIDFKVGFNLLVAGTGYGKTEVWKKLAYEKGVDGESIHNILVCEPRNSIIVSKYDNDTTRVYGSATFPTTPRGLVISNYDKLIRQKNIDWFNNFEYFVIDESHLLFSESYRDLSVIDFIKMLYEIKDRTKIIFQTATPTDEDDMFDIDNKQIFYVNKKSKKKTEIEYINTYGENVYNALALAENELDNKKCDKVFIYNGTGSVIKDEAVKEYFQGKYKTLVYHRKATDKETMKILDEQQKLDDYEILIASTAASVGIDINDENCRVLLIIIGNITFEEEMQVAGRFRKCNDMKIVELVGNGTYNDEKWANKRKYVYDTLDDTIKTNNLYDSVVTKKLMMSGVNIGNVTDKMTKLLKYFQIKNNDLRSTYNYKRTKYNEYGWNLIERKKDNNIIEVLKTVDGYDINTDFSLTKNDKFYEITVDNKDKYRIYGDNENGFVLCRKYYDLDNITIVRHYVKDRAEKGKIMKGKIYDIVSAEQWTDNKFDIVREKFPELDWWMKTLVRIHKYYNPLFKLFSKDFFIKNMDICYVIINFLNTTEKDNFDWAEWEIIKLCREIRDKQGDVELGEYAYLLWCLYGSDETKNKLIKNNYRKIFVELFDVFMKIDCNVFACVKGMIKQNNFVIDYENDDIFTTDIEAQKKEIIHRLYKSHYYTGYDINRLIDESKEIKDKIIDGYNTIKDYYRNIECGKSRKKSVKICELMPERTRQKYSLKIGQQFESCNELANKTNNSNKTISSWRKKGWIE